MQKKNVHKLFQHTENNSLRSSVVRTSQRSEPFLSSCNIDCNMSLDIINIPLQSANQVNGQVIQQKHPIRNVSLYLFASNLYDARNLKMVQFMIQKLKIQVIITSVPNSQFQSLSTYCELLDLKINTYITQNNRRTNSVTSHHNQYLIKGMTMKA